MFKLYIVMSPVDANASDEMNIVIDLAWLNDIFVLLCHSRSGWFSSVNLYKTLGLGVSLALVMAPKKTSVPNPERCNPFKNHDYISLGF